MWKPNCHLKKVFCALHYIFQTLAPWVYVWKINFRFLRYPITPSVHLMSRRIFYIIIFKPTPRGCMFRFVFLNYIVPCVHLTNTSENFYLLFILKAYNGLMSPNGTNLNIFLPLRTFYRITWTPNVHLFHFLSNFTTEVRHLMSCLINFLSNFIRACGHLMTTSEFFVWDFRFIGCFQNCNADCVHLMDTIQYFLCSDILPL